MGAHHRAYVVIAGGGVVLGWVALTPASTRAVYSGVAEVSIYVHPCVRGAGIHRSQGFRIVGVRERIAQHRGRWRDMLLLERHDGGAERWWEVGCNGTN